MDINKYQQLEERLFGLKKIKIFKYITPTNLREQKREFLKGKIDRPQFKYLKSDYDTDKVEKEIDNILSEIPNEGLGRLLLEKGQEIKLYNKIIGNIGNKDVAKNASIDLFGIPSEKLINEARKVLNTSSDKAVPKKPFEAKEVALKIKDYLNKLGLVNWKVVVREQTSVAIFTTKRIVAVASLKKYSENDIKRLLVHEIDVHALRGENGHLQPLKLFARGLKGFLSTGDGIALHFEKQNKVMETQREREIALRVIAVDLVHKGKRFKEVFEFVNTHEGDRDKCWEITYRVFRGGGVLKDHLYLQGYLNVVNYLKNNGDLKDLYIGRIGIEHLKLTKQLIDKNILKKPKYLPSYLE